MKPLWCYLVSLTWLLAAVGQGAPSGEKGQQVTDLALFIKQKAQSRKTLIVPPGVYRLKTLEDLAIPLVGLQGKTLIFDGVKIIMENQRCCLQLVNCKDVVIRGLTIDFDPLPFTQGRIVKIDPETLAWDIALCENYPAEDLRPEGTQVYDEKGALVCPYYPGCTLEVLPGRVVRLTPDTKENPCAQQGAVGNIVVLTSLAPARGPGAIIHNVASTNVTLEKVTIYSGFTTAFHDDSSKQVTYQDCRVVPCPPESDYATRAVRRFRSTLGCAFISRNAAQGPRLLGCTVSDIFSDVVSIAASCELVTAVERKKLRVLPVDAINYVVKGDVVELLPFDGARPTTAKVIDLKDDGTITDEEREYIRKLPLHPDIVITPTPERLSKAVSLRLDREVTLARGSLVLATARSGSGFVIENNRFGPGRGSGLDIRASKGLISSNVFAGLQGHAIYSIPSYATFEGGLSSGLVIEHNLMSGAPVAAMRIEAPCGAGKAAAPGAHQNIRIAHNTISNAVAPAISISSTRDALVNHNKIVLVPGADAHLAIQVADSEKIATNNNEIVVRVKSAAE
jgi:hypothetical protein